MLTFLFDSPVFRSPSTEENIFLAVAAKTEFLCREDFCKAAIDNNLQKEIDQLMRVTKSVPNPDQIHSYENWTEKFKAELYFKPISPDDEAAKALENFYSMNPPYIVIEHGVIEELYEIYPSEWDCVYLFFEADGMYFFYHWSTTA